MQLLVGRARPAGDTLRRNRTLVLQEAQNGRTDTWSRGSEPRTERAQARWPTEFWEVGEGLLSSQ